MAGVDALRLLLRSWLIVAGGLIVGLLAAAAVTIHATPTYESISMVFVSVSPAKSVNDLNQGAAFAQQTVRSYVSVIPTQYVLSPVVRELGLKDDVPALAKKVQASAGLDTTVITIAVTDTSGRRAAAIANAIAGQVVEAAPDLTPSSADRPSVMVRVVQQAEPPDAPTGPAPTRNLLIGGVAGVIAALALVLLRYRLRTRATSVAELETDADADVIGIFPRGSLTTLQQRSWSPDGAPPGAMASRAVHANLSARFGRPPDPAFMISSSVAGESRTALALALALNEVDAGRSVLLVDADVAQPTVARLLDLPPSAGMSEYLTGERPLYRALRRPSVDGMAVLAADQPGDVDAVTGPHLHRIIAEARSAFTSVLVLAPPILDSTEAATLAAETSAVVLACDPAVVRRHQLRAAARTLGRMHLRLAGLVITGSPRRFDGLRPTRSSRRRKND